MIPRIAIGTITYNDHDGLKKLLETTYGHVQYHFIIDGKFPNYPGRNDFSNDGTPELIWEYQRKKQYPIYYVRLAADEYSKRQRYLELCDEYRIEALLIIDTDEYVSDKTIWELFYKELEEYYNATYNVFGIVIDLGNDNEKPRLWIRPYEMTYVNGSHKIFKSKFHDEFLDIDGCMYMQTNKIKQLSFVQDQSFRSKEGFLD